MSVDWSQFRDGDKVRVVFEGVWRNYADGVIINDGTGCGPHLYREGYLKDATSAELIERPFTPPPAGKLFRTWHGVLFISLGDAGYCMVRDSSGSYMPEPIQFPWTGADPKWLAAIEVLDI